MPNHTVLGGCTATAPRFPSILSCVPYHHITPPTPLSGNDTIVVLPPRKKTAARMRAARQRVKDAGELDYYWVASMGYVGRVSMHKLVVTCPAVLTSPSQHQPLYFSHPFIPALYPPIRAREGAHRAGECGGRKASHHGGGGHQRRCRGRRGRRCGR